MITPAQTRLPESDFAEAGLARSGAFLTTHWSAVTAAGQSDSPAARAALEELCQAYWYPLYAFVRRSGHSPEDAKDLTQGFFAQLLAHNWVASADPARGRFRSFLLTALRRFLIKEWGKARTLKRGGAIRLVPLELDTAETRYSREPADHRTPEQVFEKQWAVTLLASVLKRLRENYARDGKAELFQALERCLVGDREDQPYAMLGARLGMSEAAVKMAVRRLRERYRECLKDEIASTVASTAEVEGELHHLFRVLRR